MKGSAATWIRAAVLVLLAAVVVRAVLALPWGAMAAEALAADPVLLAAACVVSLASLVVKGSAWHLLLKPVVPCRWSTAQEANFVGAAVNTVSVSFTGEAARVAWAVRGTGGAASLIAATIAWTRAAEGFGLAVFLSAAPLFLEMPPPWGRVQVAAALLFWAGVAVVAAVAGTGTAERFPRRLRPAARRILAVGSPGRLVVPTGLALLNWGAQWGTFHLVLMAVSPVSPAASFAAMMAANLGGLFRLLPANVVILQASMTAALLPFGVSPGDAVTAGLLLQSIQLPPVLAIGTALAGFRGLWKKEEEWTTAPSMIST